MILTICALARRVESGKEERENEVKLSVGRGSILYTACGGSLGNSNAACARQEVKKSKTLLRIGRI